MLERGLVKAEARHVQALRGLAIAGGHRTPMAASTQRKTETVFAKPRTRDMRPRAPITSVGEVLPVRQGEDDAAEAIATRPQLVSAALALMGPERWTLSASERELAVVPPSRDTRLLAALRKAIRAGGDPLGDSFGRIYGPESRRRLGATYTPASISTPMLRWAADQGVPARVVDPGAGSGRFLVAAGQRFPACAAGRD
jgi:hypothetical protein